MDKNEGAADRFKKIHSAYSTLTRGGGGGGAGGGGSGFGGYQQSQYQRQYQEQQHQGGGGSHWEREMHRMRQQYAQAQAQAEAEAQQRYARQRQGQWHEQQHQHRQWQEMHQQAAGFAEFVSELNRRAAQAREREMARHAKTIPRGRSTWTERPIHGKGRRIEFSRGPMAAFGLADPNCGHVETNGGGGAGDQEWVSTSGVGPRLAARFVDATTLEVTKDSKPYARFIHDHTPGWRSLIGVFRSGTFEIDAHPGLELNFYATNRESPRVLWWGADGARTVLRVTASLDGPWDGDLDAMRTWTVDANRNETTVSEHALLLHLIALRSGGGGGGDDRGQEDDSDNRDDSLLGKAKSWVGSLF